jgi:hypothetical protein
VDDGVNDKECEIVNVLENDFDMVCVFVEIVADRERE